MKKYLPHIVLAIVIIGGIFAYNFATVQEARTSADGKTVYTRRRFSSKGAADAFKN